MAFVKFLGIEWPNGAPQLLRVSVQDVQAFRDQLRSQNAAPKTLNRRVSSLSSFYKYLAAAAAELRLPIIVSNPAGVTVQALKEVFSTERPFIHRAAFHTWLASPAREQEAYMNGSFVCQTRIDLTNYVEQLYARFYDLISGRGLEPRKPAGSMVPLS